MKINHLTILHIVRMMTGRGLEMQKKSIITSRFDQILKKVSLRNQKETLALKHQRFVKSLVSKLMFTMTNFDAVERKLHQITQTGSMTKSYGKIVHLGYIKWHIIDTNDVFFQQSKESKGEQVGTEPVHKHKIDAMCAKE